jgi:Domain of unknown function (DUF4132)
MDESEQIQLISTRCRQFGYPVALVDAIVGSLRGEAPLSRVEAEYAAFRALQQASWPSYLNVLFQGLAAHGLRHFHGFAPYIVLHASDSLSTLDRRVLDICVALDSVSDVFAVTILGGPIMAIRDDLVARGFDDATILRYAVGDGHWNYFLIPETRTITALGHFVLSYLPGHADDVLAVLRSPDGLLSVPGESFIQLLLAADPPLVDLAYHDARQVKDPATGVAGRCAAMLLAVDPERFTPYIRSFARRDGMGDSVDRGAALTALLRHDPQRHLDLAEDAVVDADVEHVALPVVTLLHDYDGPEVNRVLQRCAAEGDLAVALPALETLLARSWEGQEEFVASLLPHRSKRMRDRAAAWLTARGESIAGTVAPYLEHGSADTRLAAVAVLGGIKGEAARRLLLERRARETAPRVKEAILGTLQVQSPEGGEDEQAPGDVVALRAEAEAAATTQGAQGVPAWFDPAGVGGLRWTDGRPVQPAVTGYLLACQTRTRVLALDPRVARVVPHLDPATTGDAALVLWTGWTTYAGPAQKPRPRYPWVPTTDYSAPARDVGVLGLIAALARRAGDERLIPLMRAQIDAWAAGRRGAVAAQTVAALALIGSDRALAEVDDITRRVKHAQVKRAAQAALEDAAARMGVTPDELSDRVAPRLGLDARGERVFDYGPRRFVARLDLKPHVVDEAGKRLPAPPRPGAKDDAQKAAAALDEWRRFKSEAQAALKAQVARLESALVTQRAWSVAGWQELFLRHPLLRPLGVTFVWGLCAEDAGDAPYALLFRPLEDWTLTGAADEPVQLPARGHVRLVHPVELDEETRAAWLTHLADYEITPPFPQLARPVIRVAEEEREAVRWEGCKGVVMNGAAFKGRYLRAGWRRGSVQDNGIYYCTWKPYPAAGVEALLETTDLGVGYEQEQTVALVRLYFLPAGTAKAVWHAEYELRDEPSLVRLGDVPPVAFSETLADVRDFAAAGDYYEDWEQRVGWS